HFSHLYILHYSIFIVVKYFTFLSYSSHPYLSTLSLHAALPFSRARDTSSPSEPAPRPSSRASPFPLPRCLSCDAGVQVRLYVVRSEEHTSELQSPDHLVCRFLL